MLAEKNVKFYMNDSVMEVRGQDGKVKEVVLKSTRVLPADVFIVGIGEFNLQLSTITFTFLVLRYFQQSQQLGGFLPLHPTYAQSIDGQYYSRFLAPVRKALKPPIAIPMSSPTSGFKMLFYGLLLKIQPFYFIRS